MCTWSAVAKTASMIAEGVVVTVTTLSWSGSEMVSTSVELMPVPHSSRKLKHCGFVSPSKESGPGTFLPAPGPRVGGER